MRHLRDFKYYLRNRFVNKTHVVELPGVKKGSWCDVDSRMFEACFELLKFYVEKDRTLEGLEQECKMDSPESLEGDYWPEGTIAQAERARKVRELYNWYINEYKDPWEVEDTQAAHDEENKRLHELIDVRLSLWT
jgi:hypothetical protein